MLHELRAFLPMADKVRARNPTMSILNYLCIENGAMRITDLETTIIIPVDDDRSYTLPISIMKQILRQRPATLEITPLGNNQMKIIFDNSSVVFPVLDVEEYPSVPKQKFKKIGVWPKEIFLQLYKQLDVVSNDGLKPALAGVWVNQNGKINSCATDGHCMEFVENLHETEHCKMIRPFTGILASKVVGIMAKFFRSSITVYSSDNYIRFELPNKIQVYSRLIDEHYPEVETTLSQQKSNTVKIDKKQLLRAINTCLPFTNSGTRLGILTVKNGSIAITTRDAENSIEFSTNVPTLERKGNEITVGFNMAYLNKIIKSVNGDIVWLYENPISASLFRSGEPNHNTHLLMPVRLEGE